MGRGGCSGGGALRGICGGGRCVMSSIGRGDIWTDYERVWLTIISAGFPKDQRRDCAEDG